MVKRTLISSHINIIYKRHNELDSQETDNNIKHFVTPDVDIQGGGYYVDDDCGLLYISYH